MMTMRRQYDGRHAHPGGRGVAPIDLDNGRARLSRDDVRAMREARSQGKSVKSIAEQFGVHASHASRVLRGLRRQAVQ